MEWGQSWEPRTRQARQRQRWLGVNSEGKVPALWTWACSNFVLEWVSAVLHKPVFSLGLNIWKHECLLPCLCSLTHPSQAWASHCCAIYFPVPGAWHRVGVHESFVVELKWIFWRELWKTPLCNFWPSWIIVGSIRLRWIGKRMSKRNEALRLWEMCLRPFTC